MNTAQIKKLIAQQKAEIPEQTIESANQAVKEINARWGDGEVFAQQKEALT